MHKKIASCLMSTLLMTGAALSPQVKASTVKEWSLETSSSSEDSDSVEGIRTFIFEQLRKIERHIFEEINIQDYLIKALEKSYEDLTPGRTLFALIDDGRALNFLDLSKRLLFYQIIGVVLNSHRFEGQSYEVDKNMIEEVMSSFAIRLTRDQCKKFAEKLHKDPQWLKNMIKLDLIEALELKLDGRLMPLKIIIHKNDVKI